MMQESRNLETRKRETLKIHSLGSMIVIDLASLQSYSYGRECNRKVMLGHAILLYSYIRLIKTN